MEIKTTPIEKYMPLTKRLKVEGPQFTGDWYANGYPRQRVGDKVAKSLNLPMLGASEYDPKAKKLRFQYMVGSGAGIANAEISYAQICDVMMWKSFKYDAKRDLMIPKE